MTTTDAPTGLADGDAASAPARLDGLDGQTRLMVLAKAASALGEPVRLGILQLLREHGELTVAALTEALPVSQPRVSIHLRCLTDCGYTTVRRAGRRAHYQLAGPAIEDLLDELYRHAARSLDGLLACLHCTPADADADATASCC